MKKSLCLLLAAALAFGLCACSLPGFDHLGEDFGEQFATKETTEPSETTQPTEATTEPTEATTKPTETTVAEETTADGYVIPENLLGHWACVMDGTCYGVSFWEDNTTSTWIYESETSPNGIITDMQQTETTIEMSVHFPEREYAGDHEPAYDVQYSFSSPDNFEHTLISNGVEFVYLGASFDDALAVCEYMLYG